MPKTRKTERKKGKWSAEAMQLAINAVNNGKGKRQTSREYGIPYGTLCDRLKTNNSSCPQIGRSCTFSTDQELEIAEHCMKLAKVFYGLTPKELRKVAYDYAEQNNIAHRFNKDEKLAGKDWFQSFLRRQPRLSLRKPESTSLARITGFNKDSVQKFYGNLNEILTAHDFQPNRIFNVDETGITTVHVPKKVLAPKGIKQLGKAVSGERGRNITVVLSVSATGVYVPPLFIYPRARMSDQLKRNGPVGAAYECSPKGWMTEELFVTWLRHFKKHSSASKENKVLLVLDNHGSRITLEAFNFCRENGISMVSFPPHTSHKLQPLDLTVFGPLKTAYSTECSLFMKQNPYQKITPFDVADLFNRAFINIATVGKAQKGFEISGIVPYNPNIFNKEDFCEMATIPIIEETEPLCTATEGTGPSTINSPQPGPTRINSSEPSPSRLESPQPGPSRLESPQSGSSRSDLLSVKKISVAAISPLPENIKKNIVKKRGRPAGTSKILTASPEEVSLKLKQKKKMERERKNRQTQRSKKTGTKPVKPKTKTQKVETKYNSSSSDSDEDVPYDDDTSEYEGEESDEICIICGEFGKTEMWFRCGVCKKWAHKECSGHNDYKTFICDFCIN